MIESPIYNLDLALRGWTDGSKHIISGKREDLLNWVENFPFRVGAIYVVSNEDVVYTMEQLRPELTFYRVVNNGTNT